MKNIQAFENLNIFLGFEITIFFVMLSLVIFSIAFSVLNLMSHRCLSKKSIIKNLQTFSFVVFLVLSMGLYNVLFIGNFYGQINQNKLILIITFTSVPLLFISYFIKLSIFKNENQKSFKTNSLFLFLFLTFFINYLMFLSNVNMFTLIIKNIFNILFSLVVFNALISVLKFVLKYSHNKDLYFSKLKVLINFNNNLIAFLFNLYFTVTLISIFHSFYNNNPASFLLLLKAIFSNIVNFILFTISVVFYLINKKSKQSLDNVYGTKLIKTNNLINFLNQNNKNFDAENLFKNYIDIKQVDVQIC
ncbi:hypothetical protein NPX79_02605 [Spiroplasma endosymbiont of Anurida maritima]|uniref:hypothetical protein n=1 Tax=Spiroplasma endosymbiont of Anurida maritima TaxID=2967972 RepID=UPI0036D3B4FE